MDAHIALYIQDAYVLFEKCCEIAIKPADTPSLLASKLLALELMLSILETSNNSLRSVSMFISAIKSMLCPSILQTCLSNNVKVASLSLKIFVALVTKFQDHLKREIEVFILHLFLKLKLRYLEIII